MPREISSCWGDADWTYTSGQINYRGSSVTSKDDIDFENYPPFIYNRCPEIADNNYPYLLYHFVNSGLMELNTTFDKTPAFVGFASDSGTALLDLTAFNRDSWEQGDISQPTYEGVTDNNSLTYILMNCEPDATLATPRYTGWGRICDTTYETSTHYIPYPWTVWSPNADIGGSLVDSDSQKSLNLFLRNNTFRSWGIKSIFLVIYVVYKSGTSGSNPTFSKVSLHDYLQHETTWFDTHPICSAYAEPHIRNSSNGSYTTSKLNRGSSYLAPALLYTIKTSGGGTREDYRITAMHGLGGSSVIGSFPLYGYIAHDHQDNTNIFVPLADGDAPVPVWLGLRAGYSTLHTNANHYMWLEVNINENEGFIDYLMSTCAMYGMFFSDGVYNFNNTGMDEYRWLDSNMCLPIIDVAGYTHGEYTRGTGNISNPVYEWADTDRTPYRPDVPPPSPDDPTIYSDTTDFNLLGGVASCNKMYAVQASSIMNLARALSTAISLRGADVPPLDYSLETFLTNNPLDCIISLRYYPTTAITSGTEEPISFGSYTNASVTGIPFIGSFKKLDFKFSVSARNALYPHFGDFRDYEPYTHAELIVPFCGTVPINPCDFIGHDINVHMIVDYITGSCTAYIAADGLVVTSIAGQIGIDVPLSGIQQATLDGQRVNAVLNRQSAELNATNAAVGGLTSAIGFAGSLASDNIVGAIGSGAGVLGSINRFQQADISYQKADYDLKHMQVPFKTVSAGSPVASTVIESCCRLIIYRPVLDDSYNAGVYAQTVGFACLMNGTVSQFTGLTVGNINTDGLNVTESEKQMIQKAFANGVIL